MTDGLRELLQQYGVLSVTLARLESERPGTEFENLDGYYKSLGGPLPDETVLAVRISKDGEIRFLKEGQHDLVLEDQRGKRNSLVTVLELPEDEFWFFHAFRPALFDLDKGLPAYAYGMGIAHAYALFEGYLSEILRARLRQHPRLMGSKRQVTYDQIFSCTSKDALLEDMIEREIRDLTSLPIVGLLQKMRDRFGFRYLTKDSING